MATDLIDFKPLDVFGEGEVFVWKSKDLDLDSFFGVLTSMD